MKVHISYQCTLAAWKSLREVMHCVRGLASEDVYSKPIFGYMLHELYTARNIHIM